MNALDNPTGLASLTVSLTNRLERRAVLKTKTWWENYVKGSAPFLGVTMADVRSATHEWFRDDVSITLGLDAARQFDLALSLVFEPHTEQKVAGVLFLQEILLPTRGTAWTSDVEKMESLFSPTGIYDWNVCDWFCVKVLGPMIKQHGTPCARRIASWCSAENVWKARSSLVAFVPVAGDAAHYPLIDSSSRQLIRREERFAKTAVGWILREVSAHEPGFVRGVLDEILPFCTPEVIRNATKYFGPGEQRSYRDRLRDSGRRDEK